MRRERGVESRMARPRRTAGESGRTTTAFVFAAALAGVNCLFAAEPAAPPPAQMPATPSLVPGAVGTSMPRPELPAIGSPATTVAALAGKVVIWEFWATWCTPCRIQVEILEELLPRATAAGVEIVGVATGEPEDLVAAHLAKEPSPYPNFLDREEKMGTAIQVLALPTVVVVDREGKIVWRNTGLSDRSMLERALEAAGAPLAAVDAPAPTPGR